MRSNLARGSVMVLLCLLISSLSAFAQKDKLEGYWLSDSKNAKIQIYRSKDSKFYGKIVWLKEPMRDGKPKVDARNPDEKLKTRPIVGLVILKGLESEGEGNYDDGSIYDPKNGKTYSCKATLRDNGELALRGYMGVSLLGRTSTWTRAD